mgnify:FL=1
MSDADIRIGVDILNTEVAQKTGNITCQTGDVVNQDVESQGVEWIQHVGYASRPPNPDAGVAACQGVIIERGGRDTCIASQDARGQQLAGILKPGETCMYGAGADGLAQGRVICKQDGSVTLFTTSDNTSNGKSVYLRIKPTAFEVVAPWGTLKFDDTGLHVLHSSGASFDLGGIYGLPAPFDAAPFDQLTSYVKAQAGTVNITSSAQSLGAGAGQPLAGAPQVLAMIASLQTQMSTVANALATVAAAGIAGSAAAAGTAAATAVSTAASAAASLALLVPTSTSSS